MKLEDEILCRGGAGIMYSMWLIGGVKNDAPGNGMLAKRFHLSFQ